MNEIIIKAENISKSYGKKPVVRGLNMNVHRGNVYALLGNNGVGKTTTIKMLVGQMVPDSGSISVFGLDPVKHGVEVKQRTAYVAEIMKVYDWMTLEDLFKFVKSFYPAWNDERCARLTRTFELPLNQKMKDFSRGMYAKGTLLAAICREPDLLVLDDPCLGLDTVSRRNFMEMLVDSLEDYEKTVVLSTHLIQEAAGIVDRAGIMNHGRLVVEEDTAVLQDRTRQLTVAAEQEKLLPELKVINRRDVGSELLLTVAGDEKELGAALQKINGLTFKLDAMSLEDIFLAYTSD